MSSPSKNTLPLVGLSSPPKICSNVLLPAPEGPAITINSPLATLISSGVPILQALGIVEKVVGNEVISRVIKSVHDGVSKGEKIAQPLKISEEFPADTIQMIAVGEETGNLDGMLNKISDFYEVSINYSIKRLTALLEPVFLVIMGAVVGFIVSSLLLPMFDLMKTIQR